MIRLVLSKYLVRRKPNGRREDKAQRIHEWAGTGDLHGQRPEHAQNRDLER